MVANTKQVGDRGVDGRGTLVNGGLALSQVKGGKFKLEHLRGFIGVVKRENAVCGIYIMLNESITKEAKIELSKAGQYKLGATKYPRVQLWSVEEFFQNKMPHLPPMKDPHTGKQLAPDLFGG